MSLYNMFFANRLQVICSKEVCDVLHKTHWHPPYRKSWITTVFPHSSNHHRQFVKHIATVVLFQMHHSLCSQCNKIIWYRQSQFSGGIWWEQFWQQIHLNSWRQLLKCPLYCRRFHCCDNICTTLFIRGRINYGISDSTTTFSEGCEAKLCMN